MIDTMDTNVIELNDNERQLFGHLFSRYADTTGATVSAGGGDNGAGCPVVHKSVAKRVLTSSQLEPNVLDQIQELCGSSCVPWLSRHQFYSMLKLVGAAQSGLPLNPHTLTANALTIPLPQLTDLTHKQLTANNSNCEVKSESISNQMSGSLPPPPTKSTVRSNRRTNQFNTNNTNNNNNIDNRQPIQTANNYNTLSNNHINYEQNESTISRSSSENDLNESPIDPIIDKSYSSYRDKSWSDFNDKPEDDDKPKNWQDFEESHCLLEDADGEEDEEEAKSTVSSEDDSSDIFTITDEQRNYYSNQFMSIQPNLNGLITGNKAKDFFEKSSLPIQELSQIWLLSDIDKDGALTLNEFCIAMHLVVLRRNNVDLPTQLPTNMLPLVSIDDTIDGYIVPNNYINNTSAQCIDLVALTTDPELNYDKHSSPPQQPQQHKDLNENKGKDLETLSPQNKQWTKFTDSPTNQIVMTAVSPPSTSSSAGIQTLANFDFSAASIVRDPKILHPVAVRLSPDGQPIRHNSTETNSIVNHSADGTVYTVESTRTSTIIQIQGKKDPPPPPPPRPYRRDGHARSSSLDLNRVMIRTTAGNDLNSSQIPVHLKISNSEYTLTPPKVLSINPRNVGAFHAYQRKTKTDASLAINNTNNINNYYELEKLRNKYKLPPEVPIPENCLDGKELWNTIRALQDYNKIMVDMNNDLLLEVLKVIDEKQCLELRLAQLNNGYKS